MCVHVSYALSFAGKSISPLGTETNEVEVRWKYPDVSVHRPFYVSSGDLCRLETPNIPECISHQQAEVLDLTLLSLSL